MHYDNGRRAAAAAAAASHSLLALANDGKGVVDVEHNLISDPRSLMSRNFFWDLQFAQILQPYKWDFLERSRDRGIPPK